MAKRTSDNRTWVEVSKKALHRNVAAFRSRLKDGVKFCAVVKANAYGHGLVETARTVAPKADWFAVDSLDEALALKKARITKPILVLGWTPDWMMHKAAAARIRLTVSTPDQVRAAAAAGKKAGKTMFLHLKI